MSIPKVLVTINQLRPNDLFTRPNGEKVFVYEGHKRWKFKYVHMYYSEDNPHDERVTTNSSKKVELIDVHGRYQKVIKINHDAC